MPWFNVDDGFSNSKPVLRIPRRYRCAAIGLWTLAGSWSAKELMDGFIPEEALQEFASTHAMAALLVNAGLWRRVEGGWQFENWAKYQRTKAQVYAYRAAEAERKQRYRSKAKSPDSEGVSRGMSQRDTTVRPAGTPGGVRSESALPIPTPEPTPNQINTSLTLVEGGAGGDALLPTAPKGAKRSTQIRDDYMPPKSVVAVIRAENPHVTDDQLSYQHRKFIDHWKKTGKPMRDWDAAWRNWMRTAGERGDFARTPNTNHIGKPTQKAMGWEAAGNALLAEMEQQ